MITLCKKITKYSRLADIQPVFKANTWHEYQTGYKMYHKWWEGCTKGLQDQQK